MLFNFVHKLAIFLQYHQTRTLDVNGLVSQFRSLDKRGVHYFAKVPLQILILQSTCNTLQFERILYTPGAISVKIALYQQ